MTTQYGFYFLLCFHFPKVPNIYQSMKFGLLNFVIMRYFQAINKFRRFVIQLVFIKKLQHGCKSC